eukprot:TRINITY_DN4170_c0_g1_i1.p1 TRINITY_DN4170_c0_g1~~TRINITY_DN4170_c0_g1_i1.p1  ORF type:complete len:405 (+),score=112.07 TRINITY_DN4170_c0_g1_i1:294-1508(+)
MSVVETEYYERLEVEVTATQSQIKKAYYKMAMKHHPDRNQGDEDAAEIFKSVSEAYEILSDPEKRDTYDRFGESGVKEGPGFDASDLFSSFFGGFGGFGGGQRARRGPKKTKDMVSPLRVDLEDMYNGTIKKMRVKRDVVCQDCLGSGAKEGSSGYATCMDCDGSGIKVSIQRMGPIIQQYQHECDTCNGQGETLPNKFKCSGCNGKKVVKQTKIIEIEVDKGVDEGKKIIVRGEADEKPGYQTGDLVFVIQQKEHDVFERSGEHLIMSKTISLVDALTGFSFKIEHLDGREVLINIKKNDIIKDEDVREIPDLGMPVHTRPFQFGLLYVKFNVEFPETLSDNQIGTLRGIFSPTPLPETEDDVETKTCEPFNAHRQQNHHHHQSHQYYDDSSSEERRGGCNQQ